MYNYIIDNNRKSRKLFLDFPSLIYKENNPQDYKTEKQILEKKHPISKDIEIHPIMVTDEYNNVICRSLMTYYKNDNTAYVGFFEAKNDIIAVNNMFKTLEYIAREDGKTKLLGPIDSSIYIRYRFKIDNFDKVYTGEPYNKDYYPKLWEECGFSICDRYISNKLRKVKEFDIDEKMKFVYDKYIEKNYKFISPTNKTYTKNLYDVYHLMMKMYSSFTGFKMLTKKQFLALYKPLKKVLNFDMVKLVYKNDKLYAFCIAIPNYRNLTMKKKTLNILKEIIKTKKKPDEYVILYVGADTKAMGLGAALVHHIRNQLLKNQCTSIGALIKQGNSTGKMYENLYVDAYHYVLYEKTL